jgi:hypothetical protein
MSIASVISRARSGEATYELFGFCSRCRRKTPRHEHRQARPGQFRRYRRPARPGGRLWQPGTLRACGSAALSSSGTTAGRRKSQPERITKSQRLAGERWIRTISSLTSAIYLQSPTRCRYSRKPKRPKRQTLHRTGSTPLPDRPASFRSVLCHAGIEIHQSTTCSDLKRAKREEPSCGAAVHF